MRDMGAAEAAQVGGDGGAGEGWRRRRRDISVCGKSEEGEGGSTR